jgi:thiosulfate/3-mercaptopyruvate sulfurtransferase
MRIFSVFKLPKIDKKPKSSKSQAVKVSPAAAKGWLVTALFILPVGAVQASNFLVDTEWLQKNLDNPKVRIVEVSVNPGQFERGHIPGAVNFRWHTDLVDPVRRDIATQANFQKLLRNAGVNNDTTVVLYGDNNNWFAAWGAWVFDVYGVKNVKLLDGGRVKWEAEKRTLSPRSESYQQGNIVVAAPNSKVRARLVDVIEASNKKTSSLVDIRSSDEYNGKVFAPNGVQELSVRAGHVPGAVNVPWSQAVAADGTFKSKEELKKLYANVGIDGSKPVITYCRIGERSSHTWFALSKILGYEVKNYDGSWTEYGNTVGLPITNPAGTVWGAL